MGVYPPSIYEYWFENSKMPILICMIRCTLANWNSLWMQNWRHCWMQIFFKHLMTVSKILKWMRVVWKQEYSVPYELKPRDIKKHFYTCELLLPQQKRKGFIATGDEKWIHYDLRTENHGVSLPNHLHQQQSRIIHRLKMMLCIWWD